MWVKEVEGKHLKKKTTANLVNCLKYCVPTVRMENGNLIHTNHLEKMNGIKSDGKTRLVWNEQVNITRVSLTVASVSEVFLSQMCCWSTANCDISARLRSVQTKHSRVLIVLGFFHSSLTSGKHGNTSLTLLLVACLWEEARMSCHCIGSSVSLWEMAKQAAGRGRAKLKRKPEQHSAHPPHTHTQTRSKPLG